MLFFTAMDCVQSWPLPIVGPARDRGSGAPGLVGGARKYCSKAVVTVAQTSNFVGGGVSGVGREPSVALGWGPMSGAKQLQADIAAITAVLKRCARGIAVPS